MRWNAQSRGRHPGAPFVGRSKAEETPRAGEGLVRGATLEPVRVMRRELVSPSGNVVVVDVPVYPPFRLRSQPSPAPRKDHDEEDGEPDAQPSAA